MSMSNFEQPPRNYEVSGFPLHKMPPPLKAEYNLDYPKFIQLVTYLWEQAHPDIPIKPVQSETYSRYPVIVYSLQSRSPVTNESKQRHRETVYRNDTNLRITGQRFQNVVTFTVMTETGPDTSGPQRDGAKYAESIIEAFERFMLEQVPVFKELGASEVLYTRRLPDQERTRPDEDVNERGVAFLVTLEHVIVQEIDILREIVVRARSMLSTYWQGLEFWVLDADDGNQTDNYLFTHNKPPFKVGDIVRVAPPNDYQDDTAHGEASVSIDRRKPQGLSYNIIYRVRLVDDSGLVLETIGGENVYVYGNGMGRIAGIEDIGYAAHYEIIDDFQNATPIY